MANCLNILDNAVVFLAAASLIVIVLLVWAQLYGRHGNILEQARNVNWITGLVWTYAAMLFALIAVGIFVPAKSLNNDGYISLAKGFLTLAFLMTGVNMAIAILVNGAAIFKPSIASSESLVGNAERKCWVIPWVLCWVGLGFISFYLAGRLQCIWWLWGGESLIALVILATTYMIVRYLCSRLRWYLWEKRHVTKG
jgi:hypothetical protein